MIGWLIVDWLLSLLNDWLHFVVGYSVIDWLIDWLDWLNDSDYNFVFKSDQYVLAIKERFLVTRLTFYIAFNFTVFSDGLNLHPQCITQEHFIYKHYRETWKMKRNLIDLKANKETERDLLKANRVEI